jgi:signal transduction histidine kinase
MVRKLLLVLVLALVFVSNACAQEMSLALVKQKVYDAVTVLKTEGRKAGFAKLRDADGPFRFGKGQGYIWIHNMDGLMMMHPTKPALEGSPTLDLQDSRGFLFIQAMNQLCSTKGEGWVSYLWAKPGTTEESPKSSFVKMVTLEGRDYVVGCGMYDVTAQDVQKKFPDDTVLTYDDFKKSDSSEE